MITIIIITFKTVIDITVLLTFLLIHVFIYFSVPCGGPYRKYGFANLSKSPLLF